MRAERDSDRVLSRQSLREGGSGHRVPRVAGRQSAAAFRPGCEPLSGRPSVCKQASHGRKDRPTLRGPIPRNRANNVLQAIVSLPVESATAPQLVGNHTTEELTRDVARTD
jgi:hypothetical protein